LLISILAVMFRRGLVAPFPIFLDSPMAIEVTEIYARHRELFDEQMTQYVSEKPLREDLTTLTLSPTAADSRRINDQPPPFLVMAGAGMCHLKANLWKPNTHVLMVGYQGRGSLGRLLVDGAPTVTIHGEKIVVRAEIHTLGGFSAHAGQADLLAWLNAIAPSRPRIVITHGEDGPRDQLARRIRDRFGLESALPAMSDVIEI
jgi:metallo-beta-lactamase family protein